MTKPRISKAPSHLSGTAKGWWKTIVTGWELDESSLMTLTVALEAFDRLAEARKLIDRDGVVIADPSGRMRAHPALTVEKDSRLALLRAWRQLGLDVEPPGPVGRPAGR